MNLGVDSFIPNPGLTSQCLEVKDHSSHCGQISGQSGSYQLQCGGWCPGRGSCADSETDSHAGVTHEKDTDALAHLELRFPTGGASALPHPEGFIYL